MTVSASVFIITRFWPAGPSPAKQARSLWYFDLMLLSIVCSGRARAISSATQASFDDGALRVRLSSGHNLTAMTQTHTHQHVSVG